MKSLNEAYCEPGDVDVSSSDPKSINAHDHLFVPIAEARASFACD